jgi:uncharacterized Zn finger protein
VNDFSAATLAKATALIDAGRVTADEDYPIWWVEGTNGLYRVQTDGVIWATCTCAYGLNAPPDKTYCAHVAAVLISLLNPAPNLL